MDAKVLVKCQNKLGESATWNSFRNSFMWVDIDGQKLFELTTDTNTIFNWELPQKISLVIEFDNEKVILAMQDGLYKLNLTSFELTNVILLEKEIVNNRSNDGAVDTMGRLWLGTMDLQCAAGAGKLYCIDLDLSIHPKIANTTIANGIVFNQDNTKMYFIDSATYCIKSYSYEAETAKITFDKVIISISKDLGMPDGMAIDEEGMLWVAVWGGSGVYRYNPENGLLVDKINTDAPNVTSCAFGGADMDQLIITTAKEGLSEEELAKFPLSGNLFYAHTHVKGLKKNAIKLV